MARPTRALRIDLRRAATLIDSDGAVTAVTLLDISSGGFRMKLTEPVREGELVILALERYEEQPAQIKWVLGDEAGGVFLDPVDWAL